MDDATAPPGEMFILGTSGFAWRIGLTIMVVFGWLAFLIAWLFFYAGDYDVFQNIAIFLVSVILSIGILGAAWATWGIRYASKLEKLGTGWSKPKGAWVFNTVAGIGWLIFLVIWLFFYAGDYNGYQNLAIFILSIMVLGAVTSSTWVVRWIRTSGRKP